MKRTLESLDDVFAHGFDTVVDVRSPAEFAEDHIPGAISLPVLSNEERAQVGTHYKQVSPFEARKMGAALVFRNAAHHVETALAEKPGGWRPLVYCWRGGQRSGSFAWVLREIGWRAEVVDGGYKAFRRLVVRSLYDAALSHRLILLSGYTGTAKTALLPLLSSLGIQTIDLEGLARHRGSLLGGLPGGQPSQKGFETALMHALSGLDPARPVVIEAESSKIGTITLPPALWEAMKPAPRIVINAPLEARAAYLAQAYADILADGSKLRSLLEPLRFYRGHALVDQWNALSRAGDHLALCRSLAQDHYDPAYESAASGYTRPVLARIETASLDATGLTQLAGKIVSAIHVTRT